MAQAHLGRLAQLRHPQDRFVGGSALIADRLATALGGAVRLEAPVTRIEVGSGGTVTATTPAWQFGGRQIIVTTPPLLAGRIEYEPALPPWREQLTQRTPMGSVIKCQVIYDEALRKHRECGEWLKRLTLGGKAGHKSTLPGRYSAR